MPCARARSSSGQAQEPRAQEGCCCCAQTPSPPHELRVQLFILALRPTKTAQPTRKRPGRRIRARTKLGSSSWAAGKVSSLENSPSPGAALPISSDSHCPDFIAPLQHRRTPIPSCAEQPAHLRLAEAAVARPGVADLVDESRGLLTEAAPAGSAAGGSSLQRTAGVRGS
eukprot:COSAG04_NODE_121_length_24915_cov_61.932181_12_plen_170_part_00